MDDAGHKLKRVRERLDLKFREVEEASHQIAAQHQNDEFIVSLSRLSEIENRSLVPSIFRLYSLCAIYRLDINEVLEWYGVPVSRIAADAIQIGLSKTHSVELGDPTFGSVQVPLSLDPHIDLRKTTFLSQMVQRWGLLPLALLQGLQPQKQRYALIGTDDLSMYPILRPGSLVTVDETYRRPQDDSWTDEANRPIYLLEHREGFLARWCHVQNNQLIAMAHPASSYPPEVYELPRDVEIIGQISGVAMRFEPPKRRRLRG